MHPSISAADHEQAHEACHDHSQPEPLHISALTGKVEWHSRELGDPGHSARHYYIFVSERSNARKDLSCRNGSTTDKYEASNFDPDHEKRNNPCYSNHLPLWQEFRSWL